MYRNIVIGPGRLDPTPHLQAAIKADPSLGHLVETLTISDLDSEGDGVDGTTLACELKQATICAVSNLKELTLEEVASDEAPAILAALPSPSLRALHVRARRDVASSYWTDLWLHASRFSELRVLTCEISRAEAVAEIIPSAANNAVHHVSLPRLVELHITDQIFIKISETIRRLRQITPSLRRLHLELSLHEAVAAMATILSELPSSLTAMQLLTRNTAPEACSWYLAFLPALRHLEFGRNTFVEADLVAYLPVEETDLAGS